MKHLRTCITLCFFSLLSTVLGQSVDIQTAEKIAVNFYFEQYNSFEDEISFNEISIKESFVLKENDEDALYIFNISPEGFVMVPSEKAIEPVLGYAFKGYYKPDIIDKNYQGWLQIYINKVGNLKQNKEIANTDLKQKWDDILNPKAKKALKTKNTKDIDPLLTTTWGNEYPYNIYCPEDPAGPGGYCDIGPVGTAMGQIMNYWRYPNSGTGSITYYIYPYGTISVNFEETNYEWDGMTETIDINNPHPIAELLFHCAASVETYFHYDGSGAYSSDADDALIDYFGYDASCQYVSKGATPISTWIQMLKDELDEYRPLYFSGQSGSGGWAFVLDGYNVSDDVFFHINFGLAGNMNGWYLITDAGGYSYQQGMVRNIFPGSGYPYYCQGLTTLTYLNGTIDDGSGPIHNYQDNADCNWLIAPQINNDSISGIVITFSSFHTEQNNDIISIYEGPDK